MKSAKRGKNTSVVEVLNISMNGVWMMISEYEYFLSFKEFPWFKDASISEIHNVKMMRGKYLHWPNLDVDLEIESIKNPGKYPLKYIA